MTLLLNPDMKTKLHLLIYSDGVEAAFVVEILYRGFSIAQIWASPEQQDRSECNLYKFDATGRKCLIETFSGSAYIMGVMRDQYMRAENFINDNLNTFIEAHMRLVRRAFKRNKKNRAALQKSPYRQSEIDIGQFDGYQPEPTILSKLQPAKDRSDSFLDNLSADRGGSDDFLNSLAVVDGGV